MDQQRAVVVAGYAMTGGLDGNEEPVRGREKHSFRNVLGR